MELVRLRGEPPLDDALVVIRAGVLEDRSDDDLVDKAQENYDDYGSWGLSALVVEPEDVVRVWERDPRVSRYHRVSLSTVGRVRRAGFALLDTGESPHHDIVLPDLNAETFQRLREAFDPAQRRPPERLPR